MAPSILLAPLVAALVLAPAAAARVSEGGPGPFEWPVRGALIRLYEEPASPYGAGHRGIDIAAPFGTPVLASADGTVAFSGWIAGSLYVSIEHAGGVRTTYSWLSEAEVAEGDVVETGARIGSTGHGHPDIATPHLHFGAKLDGVYVDPLLLLEGASIPNLIHLAPVLEDVPWPAPRQRGPVEAVELRLRRDRGPASALDLWAARWRRARSLA